eukprot:3188139-Amphidinium_carterae.1
MIPFDSTKGYPGEGPLRTGVRKKIDFSGPVLPSTRAHYCSHVLQFRHWLGEHHSEYKDVTTKSLAQDPDALASLLCTYLQA